MTLPTGSRSFLGSNFAAALVFATRIHGSQIRKGTEIPYISHLLAVAAISLEYGATEDEAIAALLHDAIEDAPSDLGAAGVRREIAQRFGSDVLAIVEGCTDADTVPKAAWLTRKERYIAHAAEASSSIVIVAASDTLHNVRTLLADFLDRGDAVWSRFNKDAGKDGTMGFYRGVISALQRTGHHPRLIRDLDLALRTLEEAASHRGVWPLRPS